jgi:tetrahydromethanopterin S-methyltransferase subunit B
VRIDEYRGLVEKVKGAQKEIDVTDDQIREKIKKLDDLFTEASNSFRDAGTARTNILSALDEASARGLVSQINTIAAALEQKKNDFKGGITKEITDLTTKITDQMKSVKEQAKALEEKATNMHKELDGIQLPLKGSAASLQPSSDNAKGVVASSAVIAQADVKQTTSVVVRKKIKIEEKSSIRLSIESIISAFSDMYEIVKEKVLGIWAVFFGKTQKEDAPISTEIKVKKVLADQTVSDSEKKQYIEFMKQERISQLERLKRIDADLKDQGIELKTP